MTLPLLPLLILLSAAPLWADPIILRVADGRVAWTYTPTALPGAPVATWFELRYDSGAWTNVGMPIDAMTGAGAYAVPLAPLPLGPHTVSVVSCAEVNGKPSCSDPPTSTTYTEGTPPPVLECPAPGVGTFAGCYYSGQFGALLATRTDPTINFNWAAGSPFPAVPVDNFSVRWSGDVTFGAGDYEFTTRADDGVRLYLDGVKLIENWTTQSATTKKATKTLTAGAHRVMVEYFEQTGQAVAQAAWTAVGPVTPPPPLPVNCTYTAWSPWVTITTETCDPATSTRHLTQQRERKVDIPASNGGTCTEPLTETQVITEPCTVPVPPTPPPLTPTISGVVVSQCTAIITADPPDATGGWSAQFQRQAPGSTFWASVGSLDSAAPYQQSGTLPAGALVRVRWTKTGATTVYSPSTPRVCP